ncbi:unnamed protein product [Lampetra planeri]
MAAARERGPGRGEGIEGTARDPIASHYPDPLIQHQPDPITQPHSDPIIRHNHDLITRPITHPDPITHHNADPITHPDPITHHNLDPITHPHPDPITRHNHDLIIRPITHPDPITHHNLAPITHPDPVTHQDPITHPITQHDRRGGDAISPGLVQCRSARELGATLPVEAGPPRPVPPRIPQLIVTEVEEGGGPAAPSPLARSLSNSSTSSAGGGFSSSMEESEEDLFLNEPPEWRGADASSHLHFPLSANGSRKGESWRKVKGVFQWSPARVAPCSQGPWVQLAGHNGGFVAGEEGRVLKRLSECERRCLDALMADPLGPYVPAFYGVLELHGERYNHMEDLLHGFSAPAVMDCKMGIRTYLEEELTKAREKPRLRRDMYQKMVAIDPDAPTPTEHAAGAVTKPRYMQWRETISSSASLGFRIEGVKKEDGSVCRDFKKTKTIPQIVKVFEDFVNKDDDIWVGYLQQLEELRSVLEASPFFLSHEVIGSSLLFMHDVSGRARVRMIDFGKTSALPEGRRLSHRRRWEEGNREDGYLWGFDKLVELVRGMLTKHWPEPPSPPPSPPPPLLQSPDEPLPAPCVVSEAISQKGGSLT